jgi:hypothetical protein
MVLVAKIKMTFSFDELTTKLKVSLLEYPKFMQLFLGVFYDVYMST